MITKKDLIIAVLATFCLTATLFMIVPTTSSPDVREYDPWCDFDDDGDIDIRDVANVAVKFGAYGEPTKNVNVTNFPLDEKGDLRVSTIGEL